MQEKFQTNTKLSLAITTQARDNAGVLYTVFSTANLTSYTTRLFWHSIPNYAKSDSEIIYKCIDYFVFSINYSMWLKQEKQKPRDFINVYYTVF